MTITAQVAEPESITAQAIGLAFPDVPGFKGQGWSTQETMLVVRWLFASPDAWEQAMDTARKYPGNPHTVADTLHEQIVPRSELAAIAGDGGDPAKVNWLEIAHELIERRGDPRPAQEHAGIAGQALGLAGDAAVTMAGEDPALDGPAAVPDDKPAIAMYTAHRVDDAGKHLAHASERLDAARKASGDVRTYHMGHVAHHLDDAHRSAHQLAANLRGHYPAEGAELDALMGAVGLAVSVSEDARTATTAHLTQTICNHLAHTLRHVAAMGDDPDPDVWGFNADHARIHLDGAVEHVGKIRGHLEDNYPAEGGFLRGVGEIEVGAEGGGGKQKVSLAGTISGQLDLAGQAGKTKAMAAQVMRATGAQDQETDAGNLSELVAVTVMQNWKMGDSGQAFQAAAKASRNFAAVSSQAGEMIR